jgi:hypothetical protein
VRALTPTIPEETHIVRTDSGKIPNLRTHSKKKKDKNRKIEGMIFFWVLL